MSSQAKNILICGGSGFMGSHFIRHLYRKYLKYSIINFDLLTYAGNPDNLVDIEQSEKNVNKNCKRYTFVRGDICNKEQVNRLFTNHRFDIVINFAAESHVDRSILDAMQFVKTNIHGAYILLETARLFKIPRFIYISTDEVYGDIPLGTTSSEHDSLSPTNPYAASKASADLITQSFIKTHKFPALIIRSSNNYGSHQYPEKLHPLVITNLLEDRPIPLHGDGQHRRSWVHVQDFCSALDLVIHKGKDYEIYNIAGEERTNLEAIYTIASHLEIDAKQYIKLISDRPGPDFRYAPDATKIRKLGWSPMHKYNDAVKDLVLWYKKNRIWWEKVRSKSAFLNHYKVQSRGYKTFTNSRDSKSRL